MKLIYKSSILAAAALLLGACSDSNKWEPGPEEGKTMGVYFENLEKYDITIEVDDSRIVPVSLGRVESEEEAVVPLKVLSCPEGVKVPESVEFKAGEKTASFDLDLTDMPLKSSGMVTLQIDPAYSSLYAAGTSEMNLKVTVTGGWIVLADDLLLDYTENTYPYPQQNSVLYVLEGTQRFKIPDFMNSGLDFIFTVSDPKAEYPYIIPYTNCVWYSEYFPDSEDTYHCWYLYDTANASWPQWSPDGTSPEITYMMFYGYDDSRAYTYIGINKGYGYISSATDYDTGKYGYGDVELYFTAKFDPFAE